MKMKFMATAVDKEAQEAAELRENRKVNDSHWRLKFSDTQAQANTTRLQCDTSYTTFVDITTNGRQSFSKGKQVEEAPAEDTEGAESEDDEPAEDSFARRKEEREADAAILNKRKSIGGRGPYTNPNKKRKDVASTPEVAANKRFKV